MPDIPWFPHPVEAIEALLARGAGDALASALSHPAIHVIARSPFTCTISSTG